MKKEETTEWLIQNSEIENIIIKILFLSKTSYKFF